ncbi:hypothetical protein H5410_026431 [Solanum commersonii]|uniref:Uncharacterized protein n=1 Tax=Solanum commersonii TaxID=4109 RepID=A0A9J5YW46_SOLCO|nr:hypothetical protein H5410_026431 [Solanum commersonii]
MKIFGLFDVEIRIIKKFMDYSIRKLVKWGVCLLRGSFDLENVSVWRSGPTSSISKGSFDLENGSVWPLGSTYSIANVLTSMKSFSIFDGGISDH